MLGLQDFLETNTCTTVMNGQLYFNAISITVYYDVLPKLLMQNADIVQPQITMQLHFP